ncbi:MAG: ribosome biogenesis factor YjgA [Pseudomonadales bacterium]
MSKNQDQNQENSPDFDDENLEEKSKSQIKREMMDLFYLGEAVCDLSAKHLATVPLDEYITEVVKRVRRMPHKEARRRELRFLAKRLREIDVSGIQSAIDKLNMGSREQALEFQRLEKLRDLILSDRTAGIEATLNAFPEADRQLLNQLARNAQRESQHDKPPASARKLFKYLRELPS